MNTRSQEKRSARDALNGARAGMMDVLHDLKTALEPADLATEIQQLIEDRIAEARHG
jgi:hypothetical protein